MMVSISNTTVVVCLFLTIFFGVQLKYGMSGAALLPHKVRVEITNRLTDRHLVVKCKDKKNDLGVHQLNVGEKYSFTFLPSFFFRTTLYFCHFTWLEEDHYFDIYVEDRDTQCDHNVCSWEIFPNGPCRILTTGQKCFKWSR